MAAGHRQNASDSSEQIAEGEYHEAGWHYSSDRMAWAAPLKTEEEGGWTQSQREERVWWCGIGRRESKYGAFLGPEACPAEWVEEKVTGAHYSSSPPPPFTIDLTHWWDVPFWLAFSSVQCLLLWPRFISRALAGEEVWSRAMLTVFPYIFPVLCNSWHANLIYITQFRQDEETFSHIVGPSPWFFKVVVNTDHSKSQKLLHKYRDKLE